MFNNTLECVLSIVTGASRGNGKAIADGLQRAGSTVIRIDINQCDPQENWMMGDVTDQFFIDRVAAYCGNLKYQSLVLVNNAGITLPADYPYPKENWDQTINVNLTAPFKWIEAFYPLFLKAESGSIINITSLGAEKAFPNNPSYLAAKGGLKMLTKYYALALGKYGTRANNVGPGYMVTEMTKESYLNKATRKKREEHTFLGRWGESEDLVGICVFLASNDSKYITGQDIYVDGGWTAKGLVE